MILSPEELTSRLQKSKESRRDLTLTEVEATALICQLYFYRKLFDKFNLTLDQEGTNERKSSK